jgi:hypothetical protein
MNEGSSNSGTESNTSSNSYWLPYMNNHGSNIVLTPPPAPSFNTRDHIIGFVTRLKLTIDSSKSLPDLLYKGKQIDQLIGLALNIEKGKVDIEKLTLRYLKNSIKSLIQKYNEKMMEFKATGGSRRLTRRSFKKRDSKKSRRLRRKN